MNDQMWEKVKDSGCCLGSRNYFKYAGNDAFAGSTGVGAAKPAQTGPGVAAQNDSQPGRGWGQTVQPEGQNGQTEGQAAQAEGQTGQAEGQTAQPVGQEQSTQPVTGQEPLQVNYSAFILQQGWSAVTADNNLCSSPVNSWVTAVKANLIHIPDGTQVGIRYQVNLSGTGWLSWAEDGAETGGAEASCLWNHTYGTDRQRRSRI